MVRRDDDRDHSTAITVIVPVRNGVGTIDDCVRALLAQDYPQELIRFIIVDNGSTDGTRERLDSYGSRIHVLEEPTRGPSAARNAGILSAETGLIAFTDADCIADPKWVGALVDCHRSHPQAGFIGGQIETFQAETAVQYFFDSHFDQERSIANRSTPSVITANMSARRADLLRVGLFDEAILRGQDIDLSFRAAFDHGVAFAYAQGAIVRHIHVATLGGLFLKGTQHGLALYHLLGKHSEKVGLTRRQRLLRRGTYLGILNNLWLAARHANGPSRRSEPVTRSQRAFFQAVFDLGKQIGLMSAMLKPPARTKPSRR